MIHACGVFDPEARLKGYAVGVCEVDGSVDLVVDDLRNLYTVLLKPDL